MNQNKKKSLFQRVVGLVFIILVCWYSLYMFSPPEPKPATAAPSAFSAERAFEHVKIIAQEPHPLGANAEVRSYIINELRNMGIQTVVHEGVAKSCEVLRCGLGVVAYVKNILAKIPGTNSTKTILLMAHYDSRPHTLGAGDDGAAVAAILEALRALKSQEPLKNNVWILLTDGEEYGMLGAEYFIQSNPKWKKIDLVINVEGRGSGGTSFMFETSPKNAGLIRHYAQATPYPVASSLMYSIYELMPTNTDFSVMKAAGLKGLNFAFIGRHLSYHTMQDSPENLSLASLQHHGSNILSNIKYFGNRNFELESSENMVFFNNLRGGLITYPTSWSFTLTLAVTILFLVILGFQLKNKKITIGKYGRSILSFLIVCVLGAALTYGGWALMELLHPEYRWLTHGEVYVNRWYFWGFTALMAGLSIGCYKWLQNKLEIENLMAGILTVWIILSFLLTWYLPVAGYFLMWPALFAFTGWFIALNYTERNSWARLAILCLSLLPALFIIFPFISILPVAMTTQFLWAATLLLMLLIGLSWALINFITKSKPVYWAGAFAIIFVVALVSASLSSGFDENHKKQSNLLYSAYMDKKEAYWISWDPKPVEWSRQFLDTTRSRAGNLLAEAPMIPIEKANITLLADSTGKKLRHITLKIEADKAISLSFRRSSGESFKKVTVEGKKLFSAKNPIPGQRSELDFFYYMGDLSNPVTASIAVPAINDSISFELRFTSWELFDKLMQNYKPRPETMMPTPYNTDKVVWYNQIRLKDLVNE